jgi:hypothetical protein
MEQAVGALRTYIQVCAPERTACPPLHYSSLYVYCHGAGRQGALILSSRSQDCTSRAHGGPGWVNHAGAVGSAGSSLAAERSRRRSAPAGLLRVHRASPRRAAAPRRPAPLATPRHRHRCAADENDPTVWAAVPDSTGRGKRLWHSCRPKVRPNGRRPESRFKQAKRVACDRFVAPLSRRWRAGGVSAGELATLLERVGMSQHLPLFEEEELTDVATLLLMLKQPAQLREALKELGGRTYLTRLPSHAAVCIHACIY